MINLDFSYFPRTVYNVHICNIQYIQYYCGLIFSPMIGWIYSIISTLYIFMQDITYNTVLYLQ